MKSRGQVDCEMGRVSRCIQSLLEKSRELVLFFSSILKKATLEYSKAARIVVHFSKAVGRAGFFQGDRKRWVHAKLKKKCIKDSVFALHEHVYSLAPSYHGIY